MITHSWRTLRLLVKGDIDIEEELRNNSDLIDKIAWSISFLSDKSDGEESSKFLRCQ